MTEVMGGCADMLYERGATMGKMTRVRVSRELADEAMRVLGVRSRTEAARVAVINLIGRDRRNEPMSRTTDGSKAAQSTAKNR